MERLDDLEAFLAIIEKGSQAAAARHLRRPLQSLNRSLIALERAVGVDWQYLLEISSDHGLRQSPPDAMDIRKSGESPYGRAERRARFAAPDAMLTRDKGLAGYGRLRKAYDNQRPDWLFVPVAEKESDDVQAQHRM